jgi:hypothetical protein
MLNFGTVPTMWNFGIALYIVGTIPKFQIVGAIP